MVWQRLHPYYFDIRINVLDLLTRKQLTPWAPSFASISFLVLLQARENWVAETRNVGTKTDRLSGPSIRVNPAGTWGGV